MKKKNLLLTAIVIFGLATITMAQVPSYVPTNGLVGWWLFNGNANDLSGNNWNGTVNGATLTSDRFGTANSAFNFNGTTNYIQTNNVGPLNNDSRAISFWAKTDQLYSNDQTEGMDVFCYGTNASGQVFEVSLNHACEGLTVDLNDGVNTKLANTIDNYWHHYVINYNNTNGSNFNAIEYWKDGVILNSVCQSGNLVSINTGSSNNATIGSYFNGAMRFFSGNIDDIGYWNRALTDQEIIALYISCQQPTQPTTACYETATFNTATCQWDVTGSQPEQPNTACYETASFNTNTCQWDVTGSQPEQPNTACYETASFNTANCQWDVTGSPASISQPTNQTVNVNNNAQFLVGSSDPNASYQWQTDLGMGFQNINSVGQYSGTTTNTLSVSNVSMSNNNQPFRCIVSSGLCSDTSDVAVLTVNDNASTDEINQSILFSVFPNPVQSKITVKADKTIIGAVYSIYDNTGKVVLTGKLHSENTSIELGNISDGIYIFNVGEKIKQTFKVIKE